MKVISPASTQATSSLSRWRWKRRQSPSLHPCSRPSEPRPCDGSCLAQWSERERVALLPAVGHDAERIDQALPTMEEHRHHAEIEQFVVSEAAPEIVIERPVDLPRVRREAIDVSERRLGAIGQIRMFVVREL